MNKNFTYLLLGQFISVIGERISTLVFFSIAVSIIGTQTSFLASLLIAVQFIPLFIFGYFFGILADEFNQKNLMLISDIARAVTILFLIIYPDSLILLYFIVFLIGLFTALFEPSKKSLIPFIVDKEDLIKLNKVFALFEILAIFIGLLIGSILLEFFTIKQALFINFITYLLSFILIIFIKYKPIKIKVNKKKSIKKDFMKGINYLKKNYNAKHVILNITLINFFAAGLNFSSISNYTIKNSNQFDPGSQIGVFLITMACGALLTPIFNRILDKYKLKDSLIVRNLFLLGGIMAIVISILMYFEIIQYIELLIFFFISGILVGVIYSKILYLIHLNTDESYYGRVISINDLTSSSSTILGILIGGFIVDMFNYEIGFLITGLVFLFGNIYFLLIKDKIKW